MLTWTLGLIVSVVQSYSTQNTSGLSKFVTRMHKSFLQAHIVDHVVRTGQHVSRARPTADACKPRGKRERRSTVRCSASAAVEERASANLSDKSGPPIGPDYKYVQRNLALELVRVTEAAALAAGRWLGKGDKNAADQAAVDMMRKVLNTVNMDGVVVIGEGEKDEAPMLYCGERIGSGDSPHMEIAVDPLDGTTLISQGRNGAVSVIALAERGALFDPGPCMYMTKMAVGPDVNPHMVSLNYSYARNLQAVAVAKNKAVSDVTVVILDRPRHADIIKQCRAAGARIRLISDGDVGAAIEVAQQGAPVDVLFGVGGTPEGVIAAAALKCMGASIQGRLWPRNEDERMRALEAGYDLEKILYTDDLCAGDQVFFAATGVSDGDLLQGVRYYSGGASTNSIVMRASSGTVRMITTQHKWSKPSVTNINPNMNPAS